MSQHTPEGDGAPPVPHMSPAEFEARAAEAAAFIARYWARLVQRGPGGATAAPWPVKPRTQPGDVLRALPASPPQHGEDWRAAWDDLERLILPALTHWQHPAHWAYFPCTASFPAMIGELLSAGLGVNGFLWATGPAITELEVRVLDWMAEALGLPACFRSDARGTDGRACGGGVIQGTASESALMAVVAARHRARARGVLTRDRRAVVYASAQAHSSIQRAAMIAGIAESAHDRAGVRLIDTDESLAMRPGALDAAMREDAAAGHVPLFVCATVGTTSTLAMDDVAAAGAVCRAHGAWLHVDAAMAGSAWVCPEHRWTARGLDLADSVCVNPHKWLLTNFDCNLTWTSDRASWTRALSIDPEYLRTSATDAGAVDYRDWQVPLGRRFRALKVWLVLRHYGVEGLRAFIRSHVRLASTLEALARADARFDVLPRGGGLSLVCFRLRTGDDATRTLLARVNDSGRALLSHTIVPWPGEREARYTIRAAIGSTLTTEADVRAVWGLVQALAEESPRG